MLRLVLAVGGVDPSAKLSYDRSFMHPTDWFQREAGPLVKLWAAICSIFGWRCRCPRCGGRMERVLAMNESYVRTKRSTSVTMSIGRGRAYTYGASHPPLKITVTPLYDICERCGHRIRRGNLRTDRG